MDEGVYNAVSDPKKPLSPPLPLEAAPYLNFAPLLNAADQLTKSAQHYQDALKKAGDLQLQPEALRALNAQLIRSERVLTLPQGLPGQNNSQM